MFIIFNQYSVLISFQLHSFSNNWPTIWRTFTFYLCTPHNLISADMFQGNVAGIGKMREKKTILWQFTVGACHSVRFLHCTHSAIFMVHNTRRFFLRKNRLSPLLHSPHLFTKKSANSLKFHTLNSILDIIFLIFDISCGKFTYYCASSFSTRPS